jgi:ribosome recycling factor
MSVQQNITAELRKRMEGALNTLDHDLKGVRAGRASANFFDPVVVEAYGDRMPIAQLATVSTPDSMTISVQVWDKSMVKAVEKAIANAGLGVSPVADGQVIRVALPKLSEERRKELVKVAHKYAEQSKVAVRNVRRDGMEQLKKLEKDGAISKDEHHTISESIQKLTDDFIKKIDDHALAKEKDILQG